MKWYQVCLLSVACSLPIMTYAIESLSPMQLHQVLERYQQSHNQPLSYKGIYPQQVSVYSMPNLTISDGNARIIPAGANMHVGNIVLKDGGQLVLANGNSYVHASSLVSQGGKIVVSEGGTLNLYLDEVPESLFDVHIAGTLNLQPQSGEAIIIAPKGQPLIAQDFSFQGIQLHDQEQ